MPDDATKAIDSVFDFFEGVVGKVDTALGHMTPDQPRRRAMEAAPGSRPPVARHAVGGPVSRWRIIEAIAAETSETIFVVTNGRERAECSSKQLAQRVLSALQQGPSQ